MTTIVTVTTFDDEADVSRVHPETGAPHLAPERVPAHEQRIFHVHQNQAIEVREVPKDD